METVNLSDHQAAVCANLLQQYLVAQEGEWRKWAMKLAETWALPVGTREGKVARVKRNGKKEVKMLDRDGSEERRGPWIKIKGARNC